MKTVSSILTVLGMMPAFLFASDAQAFVLSPAEKAALLSDRVGNGGFAHVCRDDSGNITSASLLDLWEAESLRPHASDAPVHEQVELALAKLLEFAPNAYRVVGFRYDLLKTAVVKTNRPLSMTEDAFPPYEPMPGCRYEQVARFEPVLTEMGTSGLRIFSEIYDHPTFTNSDRAALFVHEAIYLVDRLRNNATNSQRARTLTGHLMSESPVPNAVRMLFNYLIGAHRPAESGMMNPILAVADPMKTKASIVRMYQIEGISSDSIKGEQGEKMYRCTIGQIFPQETDHNGDTGYRPLKELVSYTTPLNLPSVTGISEFGQRNKEALSDDDTVMNSIGVQCVKKDEAGNEIPVPFIADVELEGAECMTVSQDGSTFVARGKRCTLQIEADAEYIENYGDMMRLQWIGVVRAVPATKAK